MKSFLTAFVVLMTLTASTKVGAHSEHDKSRFVSPNGQDNSRCDNVLRPCKTISYAVHQANKGDKVLLATGTYDVSIDDIFYLKSALVPVLGGYNRFDHYQSQSPQTNVTTLLNVPSSMANEVRSNGFKVISDGKSLANNKALQTKLASYQELSKSQSATNCEDGQAGNFSCENVDLLYHLPLTEMSSSPRSGNDIWGHVDLNSGREYALMGIANGLIIVDVTTPESPTEVSTIAGVDSGWRDVKVYQHFDKELNLWQSYAYLSTEGSNTGGTDFITIVDLNSLPNSATVVEKNQVVTTAHNVYISNVDYSLNIALPGKTSSLQIVGANNLNGAFQSYPLDNPKTLSEGVKRYFGEGYTHDGSSLSIDDDRASSDCGIAEGSCTLFIDFNEKEMKLWDITDPSDTKQLGTASYDDVALSEQYVHSGWGTEDKRYVLLHDEFDETRGGLNTTVRIFSIDDLNRPSQVGQWTGPTSAIDHNGFVRGNRYYMSNYERGLTILDITDPANPEHVGFFDTYPPSNNASFNGAWGVYPFLPSGNILVSDINSGLYILKDNANTSAVGQFSFGASTYSTEQGTNLTVSIERNGSDLSQPTSVSYQVIAGNANSGEDFQLADDTINWSLGDNAAKELSIPITADDTGMELPESFYIRLYNPQSGATLGSDSYTTVNIAGIVDKGAASFTEAETTVAENSTSLSVEVNRLGNTNGEISYNYELTSNTATVGVDVEQSSGQISWTENDSAPKYIDITIVDDSESEETETVTLTLTGIEDSRLGANSQLIIIIADDDNNTAPTVTLTESFQSNTGQRVELTAQVSDEENDEMTYAWEQTGGDSVTIDKADELTAYFTAPSSAQSLEFSFTATDFRGAATSQTVTITVVAPAPPVVSESKSSGGGGSVYWLLLIALSTLMYKIALVQRVK